MTPRKAFWVMSNVRDDMSARPEAIDEEFIENFIRLMLIWYEKSGLPIGHHYLKPFIEILHLIKEAGWRVSSEENSTGGQTIEIHRS